MQCEEFQQGLQQHADRRSSPAADAAMRQHMQSCDACRELHEGFRLLARAWLAQAAPAPPAGLADRIVFAASPGRTRRFLPTIGAMAAAAGVLAAVTWWISTRQSTPAIVHSKPSNPAPEPHADLIFPELAESVGVDTRDSIALLSAVEPVSQLVREFGKSLGGPIRPIADRTSEAIGNLLRELPDADSTLMSVPGMREMMGSPMNEKAMGEMKQPS